MAFLHWPSLCHFVIDCPLQLLISKPAERSCERSGDYQSIHACALSTNSPFFPSAFLCLHLRSPNRFWVMAPIRVGIIGLSKAAKTSWAGSAHLPYLIASNGKYEIKALCNSSKESAQKAIDGFNLPSSTKAYGNPQDLANDPEVRLDRNIANYIDDSNPD